MIKNLAHLEAFYWIARLGSFHAAATHLSLTQPTISIRIRNLERSMDTVLLERESRPIRPTAQGLSILSYVERIFALVDDVEVRLAVSSNLRGQIKLGIFDSYALGPLPSTLDLIRNRLPHLSLDLTVDSSRALVDKVMTGELDAAIVAHTHISDELQSDFLYFMDTAWAAPSSGAGIDENGPVGTEIEVFTQAAPSTMHRLTFDWFADANRPLPKITICNSIPVIVYLVASGAGAAILPVSTVQAYILSGAVRLVQAEPGIPPQPVFAIRQKNRRSPGVSHILALVSEGLHKNRAPPGLPDAPTSK